MSTSADERMTKGERDDLLRVARLREKVAKSAVTQREAELVADFEQQLDTRYSFDQDPIWNAAVGAAQDEIARAQAKVAERCRELGIPEQFAPGLHMGWYERGRNSVKEERTEMRRIARTRIEAIGKAARVEIERASLNVQTQLVAANLTSDAARIFLEQMPSADALMPRLELGKIEAMVQRKRVRHGYE